MRVEYKLMGAHIYMQHFLLISIDDGNVLRRGTLANNHVAVLYLQFENTSSKKIPHASCQKHLSETIFFVKIV